MSRRQVLIVYHFRQKKNTITFHRNRSNQHLFGFYYFFSREQNHYVGTIHRISFGSPYNSISESFTWKEEIL